MRGRRSADRVVRIVWRQTLDVSWLQTLTDFDRKAMSTWLSCDGWRSKSLYV